MKAVAKVAVLGLAGLTALSAAGCNRSGGGVNHQPIIGVSTPSVSSTENAIRVTPINDSKELCHQVLAKTRGLSNAVLAFWKIVINRQGWTFGDPDVSDAVGRVQKESEQVLPVLDGIVGKGAPDETAGAANDYLKRLRAFSDLITEGQTNEALNPAASSFGDAKDRLMSVCATAG